MKHKQACVLRFLLFFFLIFSDGAYGASISFINHCGFTVWPGISGNPLSSSGFELPKGNMRTLQTPEEWQGQIWGRTGCTFNGSSRGSCKTGDCGFGDMYCQGESPSPPVTLAEFTITKSKDYYDVSLIYGYNLQMTVEASAGSISSAIDCKKAGCVGDLNPLCPTELRLEGGGGCKSPCQAASTSESCNGTLYDKLFSSVCPGTFGNIPSIYTCKSANYIVRFCPHTDTFSRFKADGRLNYYDQLVSLWGNFSLGFFNYDGSYLGIWYTTDREAQKVWVANPNKPITTTLPGTIALSIDPNTGNFIITSGELTLMNITDVQAGPNPNVTATLDDTGNFRLINEIDKTVLWQSFDHPTNVLLPGMKLGFNKTTGQNWILTSWSSKESPRSGAFTLSAEPIYEGVLGLVIQQQGKPYWTRSYQDLLNLLGTKPYRNLTSVYNAGGWYLSYESSYLNLSMWVLTPEGRITNGNSVFWTPEFCYGYNSSDGCVEFGFPHCRRESGNFTKMNAEFDPGTTSLTDSTSSLSISDCYSKCWNDCSCVGFNFINNGTRCKFWSGRNSFLVYPNGSSWSNSSSKYVINSLTMIDSAIGKKTKRNIKRIWLWIPIGVSISMIFPCLALLLYMKRRKRTLEDNERRKRDEYFLELTASEGFKDVHQLESNNRNGKDLLLFSFASIMAATDDFSDENKLGQGGFGPVYKRKLSDGREIAIKRLSRTSGQGLVEFKNELILIAKLQHTNLVRVLGCCIHRDEKMLVYEYMPNKSLDFFLFDESRKAELDWPRRFNIIEGIAQGLLYIYK